MPRISLVQLLAVIVAVGLASYFAYTCWHAGHLALVRPAPTYTSALSTSYDARRVAANRDYPWVAALNGVEDMREDNRLAQLFSSNPDLKLRAAEDEIKRQLARQAVNQAEKRLAEAEMLSQRVNDPLPRWAARAVYLKARANWVLRTEYVASKDPQASSERASLETECLALIAKTRAHWDANYAGVPVVTNTPVTALP